MIGFNKPYFTGKEFQYIQEAITREKLSGNGHFTKACHEFFEKRYAFKKVLLTTSCTSALEMAAILIDVKPGDEIIMPSYTFVSTANAFILRGAKIVFCDSGKSNPNLDPEAINDLITVKTKAIVVVHYAGVACDMDAIKRIVDDHNLFLIEDAAQAIDSFYKGRPLGSFGHLAAFSFHETKNIISGEGGMLVVNDKNFIERAEIIWEKGTNRVAFSQNKVSKYNWIDIGSSFLPSELTAAFLYAQLEEIDSIQKRRKVLWNFYFKALKALDLPDISLPFVDEFATNNAHLFYVMTQSKAHRNSVIAYMAKSEVQAIFHYIPLHTSPYFLKKNSLQKLINAERYGDCLLRLPLHLDLNPSDQDLVVNSLATSPIA